MGEKMKKVEIYKQCKAAANKLHDDVKRVLGTGAPTKSGYDVSMTFRHLSSSGFMEFEACAYYYAHPAQGYVFATSDIMGKYLAEAINKHIQMLLEEAVAIAYREVQDKKKEAEEEVREALKELGEPILPK